MSDLLFLMSWPTRGFTTVATIAAWSCVFSSSLEAATVDFQRQIRPILSDNCFHCHGPDKETRMAGMRLDTRDGMLEHRKNGVPVVAGKPEESLIIKRIFAEKPAMIMPPAYSHKTL